MVSTPSSLSLLLSLLALLLCLRLILCGSRVGLCSEGLSWVGLVSGSSAFLLSLSLPPVLRFCPGPSPYPLGPAASASAHGLSGVRSPASCSTSGLLGLSLSACSLVLLTSACCSFRYLFCTSLSTFWVLLLRFLLLLVSGFCGFCRGVFGSSGSGASFLSWLCLSCLSPLVSFCCLRSSPGFWLFAVSSPTLFSYSRLFFW